MKCFNPFFKTTEYGVVAFPCGRCSTCRASQSMVWSLRMHLESLYYRENAFVTLTYSPEYLPEHSTLKPSHLQAFFKRLRRLLPYKIRYFACGEYGDRFGRPHYHAIIFGLKFSDFSLVSKAWTFGIVDVQVPNREAFQYVSGYVTKKIGKTSDWKNSNPNQFPPFCRCSLGLGLKFVLEQMPCFSSILQIDGKPRYIGRYLRNKLAEKFGCLEQVKENGLLNLAVNLQLTISEFYYFGGEVPKMYFDKFLDYRLAWEWKYQGFFDDWTARKKIRNRSYHEAKNFSTG